MQNIALQRNEFVLQSKLDFVVAAVIVNEVTLQADGDSPQKLQYLRLFAIPMDICRNTKEISSFVHEGHICTRGSPGRGTCEVN